MHEFCEYKQFPTRVFDQFHHALRIGQTFKEAFLNFLNPEDRCYPVCLLDADVAFQQLVKKEDDQRKFPTAVSKYYANLLC